MFQVAGDGREGASPRGTADLGRALWKPGRPRGGMWPQGQDGDAEWPWGPGGQRNRSESTGPELESASVPQRLFLPPTPRSCFLETPFHCQGIL